MTFTLLETDICIYQVERSGSGWAGKPTKYVGQQLEIYAQIDTPRIVDAAINESGFFQNNVSINTGGSDAELEVGTITVSADTREIEVWGKAAILTGGIGQVCQFRLRKDSLTGTILDSFGPRLQHAGDARGVTLIGLDTSPAATQVYKISIQRQAGGGNATASGRRIVVGNRKK